MNKEQKTRKLIKGIKAKKKKAEQTLLEYKRFLKTKHGLSPGITKPLLVSMLSGVKLCDLLLESLEND